MSRCYACCQENCGYTRCSCDCHGDAAVRPIGFRTTGGSPYPNPEDSSVAKVAPEFPRTIYDTCCGACGALGPHFCVGVPSKQAPHWDLERNQDLLAYAQINLPTCKRHRRYKGLRRPRTACEDCWRRWIALNPA